MSRGRFFGLLAIVCALAMAVSMVAGCGCGKKKPNISSISPSKGTPGEETTITGTGFGDTEGGSTVEFGTVTAEVESWSDTGIQTIVPEALKAGGYEVSVTTKDGTSNTADFEITEEKKPTEKETDRKQGQIEHNTPVQAILEYCKGKGIDTTGMTFSVVIVSKTDPDWKIDSGYKEGVGGDRFILHKVKGEWTVVTDGTSFTAEDLEELGAPADLLPEPEPTPAPDAQTQAILSYLQSKGQPTSGWTFSVYRVSSEDPNWEMIQGLEAEGEQGEKFLLIWNNMAGAWEVLASGEPPWTGVEFKGEPCPSDLNKE